MKPGLEKPLAEGNPRPPAPSLLLNFNPEVAHRHGCGTVAGAIEHLGGEGPVPIVQQDRHVVAVEVRDGQRRRASMALSAETGLPIWIALARVGRAAMGSNTLNSRW